MDLRDYIHSEELPPIIQQPMAGVLDLVINTDSQNPSDSLNILTQV